MYSADYRLSTGCSNGRLFNCRETAQTLSVLPVIVLVYTGYVCVIDIKTMNAYKVTTLTAQIQVNVPIQKVWELWTGPQHITQWNNLSAAWHNTNVENNARTGGKFLFRMGLKDGSLSFDHTGTYTEVIPQQLIAYTLDDGRQSTITFAGDNPVAITETFEPETGQPADMQLGFCQAVLDSFKRYAEEG